MSRLLRRWVPRSAAVGIRAWRGVAASGASAMVLAVAPLTAGSSQPSPPPLWPGTVPVLAVPAGSAASPGPASPGPAGTGPASPGSGPRQIVLPDLAVIEPQGLSAGRVARLGKLRGVTDVLAVDGAAIKVRGHQVNVIGVDPQRFRSWTPLATASDQRLWAALAAGKFASSSSTRHLLHLHNGTSYQLAGAARLDLAYGGTAAFGIRRRRRGQHRCLRRAGAYPQRGRPDQRARRGDARPQA